MIQPLRRVHLHIFVVLAIALLVVLFAGLLGRHARTRTVPAPEASFGRSEKLP